jgi:large subunit ribosomal protein L5
MYKKIIIPKIKEEFKLDNSMAVPKIEKIVINSGIGKHVSENQDFLEAAKKELAKISGQMPAIRLSKKSISAFKLRKNQPVGLVITLRGERMYYFLEKLINNVLPRVKDFHGISPKSFDKSANISIGIAEHTVFPEIDFENNQNIISLEATIVFNTKNVEMAKRILELYGMVFQK